MKILGLCGSLRINSSNALILKAVKKELNEEDWSDFNISDLPFFDPDHQFSSHTPMKVLEVRKLAGEADLIFISTPEYAHGIPGILKNALEWIFHEATLKTPVFIVIGSADGASTKIQLIDVLTTMDFEVSDSSVLQIKGARSSFASDGTIVDTKTRQEFKNFCKKMVQRLNHLL